MATIMEKDSLLHLTAYAASLISLRSDSTFPDHEADADFVAQKRFYAYTTSHEEINFEAEISPLQKIIEKYKSLPLLPEFR